MARQKTHWLGLRITPEEKQALHKLAKSHGVKLSSFIRALPNNFDHKKTA